MNTPLSAAEVKTLQSPETEQVKTILPLLLKELVLRRWLDVRKGKRPVDRILWRFFGIIAVSLFAVSMVVGLFASAMVLIAYFIAIQPKTLFSLTPAGEQKIHRVGPNSPVLARVLQMVAMARPEELDNCTNKEWRKYLSDRYPDNATFHLNFLLVSLEKQGLIKLKGDKYPERTPAGNAALARAESEIELGYELPRLLRERSPEAPVLAASLGGLLLLVPDMEGYFYTLMNNVGLPEMDLEQQQQRNAQHTTTHAGANDAGSGDAEERQEQNPDSDNGMDWESNADFLDGSIGAGGDEGIGADGGCGVGSDSSDSGGGDGGGDGGGCGGGCGGGGD
ncbi:MAG: hypothetical protein ACKVUS_10310 [Saprospiraceae bacterium]